MLVVVMRGSNAADAVIGTGHQNLIWDSNWQTSLCVSDGGGLRSLDRRAEPSWRLATGDEWGIFQHDVRAVSRPMAGRCLMEIERVAGVLGSAVRRNAARVAQWLGRIGERKVVVIDAP